MIRASPLLIVAIVACGSAQPDRHSRLDDQSDRNLVGVWDATLSLSRPYPLGPGDPTAKRICGTIGLVANHYAKDVTILAGNRPQLGVYDLDLPALGLDWLDDNVFPSAVARQVGVNASAATIAHDTIAIVLNPGSTERIVLLGEYDVRGIDGKWTAQSSRGTASGVFSLRRHANVVDRSPAC